LKPILILRAGLTILACALLAVWISGPTPEKWQRALAAIQASPEPVWTWQAYGALWLPRAAGVDAVLLLAAAILTPWFLAKAPALPIPTPPRPNPDARWVAPLVIVLMMGLSAWKNAPRLGHSLWSDEEFSMSHFIVGEYSPEQSGELSWHPVPWARAFLDHRVPNNHSAYSVLAKLAHAGQVPSTDPGAVYFSEWRLRLPAFLAGLLALPVVYLLLRELGLPRAGLFAVMLLGSHPWFVRYSTEARGYGLALFFWPLAVLCLLKALRTGHWRWWMGWGFLQTLLLWSWTGMVHWLLALNAASLGLLWWKSAPAQRFQFRRWTAAGLLATICYLPLGLPMLPQLRAWMATGRAKSWGIAPGWLADSTSWLLTGEPWRSPDPANHLCPGRFEDLNLHPTMTVAALLAGGLLFGLGLFVFARHSRETRWLLAAMLLPIATLYGQAVLTGNLLMSWYACPALPAIAIILAAPASFLTARTYLPWLALFLLNYRSGHAMRTLLRQNEMEPNRAATALTRTILNPAHPDYLKGPVTVQFSCRRPGYDPACQEIGSAEELEVLRLKALQTGRDCFVNIGDAGAAVQRWPDLMARLQDPAVFRQMAMLPGMDHAQTRVVWQAVRSSP